jgi:hypothetical protein
MPKKREELVGESLSGYTLKLLPNLTQLVEGGQERPLK